MTEQRDVRRQTLDQELPLRSSNCVASASDGIFLRSRRQHFSGCSRSVYQGFAEQPMPEIAICHAPRRPIARDAMLSTRTSCTGSRGSHPAVLLDAAAAPQRPVRRANPCGSLPRKALPDVPGRQDSPRGVPTRRRSCDDDRDRLDAWQVTGRVIQSVDRVLPGRTVKVVPTEYSMCRQAWELEVEDEGHWSEVLAWGVFNDAIVRHLGGDPSRHVAVGVGYGLERLAMLRYRIDDIRKVDVSSVA